MPRYNLETKQGYINARKNLDYHKSKGHIVDQKAIKKTRTTIQNSALHLFFKQLADKLTDMGIEFGYNDLIGKKIVNIPYTKDLVKYRVWSPLQKTIFNIDSTKKLESYMINHILDVLTLWFGEEGIKITFPNKIDKLIEQMNKSNNY